MCTTKKICTDTNFSMLKWLAHSDVQFESETKATSHRKRENLDAEIAPFCFSRPSCDDEIRTAAAYVSLIQKDQTYR